MNGIILPEGARLTYIVGAEAWYRRTDPDQTPYISVVAAAEGGGCHWEFQITEKDLGQRRPALRVEVFDDAWKAFDQIRPIFDDLAAGGVTTLIDVRELLDTYGAVDETARVSPYPEKDSAVASVELSGTNLDQILSALENRGDDTNGDAAMRALVSRLRAVAAQVRRRS